MDDIKLFAKNEKKKKKKKKQTNWRLLCKNKKNIKPGYSDEIWHRKMYYAHNEKLKKTNDVMNRTTKSRKNENFRRNGNLQILGNIGSGHDQTKGDERKIKGKKKKASQKTFRNQALQQESHRMDNHLSSHPGKMLGTILEMYEGRTSANGPEDKKANDDA